MRKSKTIRNLRKHYCSSKMKNTAIRIVKTSNTIREKKQKIKKFFNITL